MLIIIGVEKTQIAMLQKTAKPPQTEGLVNLRSVYLLLFYNGRRKKLSFCVFLRKYREFVFLLSMKLDKNTKSLKIR